MSVELCLNLRPTRVPLGQLDVLLQGHKQLPASGLSISVSTPHTCSSLLSVQNHNEPFAVLLFVYVLYLSLLLRPNGHTVQSRPTKFGAVLRYTETNPVQSSNLILSTRVTTTSLSLAQHFKILRSIAVMVDIYFVTGRVQI